MKILINKLQLSSLVSEQIQQQTSQQNGQQQKTNQQQNQRGDWRSSPKAQDTKKTQYILNSLYKTNIPVDGNWMGKLYNETLKKYITDMGLKPYVCRKGDGWCNDQEAGAVTVTKADTQKYMDIRNADYNRLYRRGKINESKKKIFEQTTPLKVAQNGPNVNINGHIYQLQVDKGGWKQADIQSLSPRQDGGYNITAAIKVFGVPISKTDVVPSDTVKTIQSNLGKPEIPLGGETSKKLVKVK